MKSKRKKPYAANNASKKWLESEGWVVCVVEQTIPHCFIKRDAFNFADLLAMHPAKNYGGIMLVQVTAGGHLADRMAKVLAEARHKTWLESGGRIQVHSWEKVKGTARRRLRLVEVEKS